MRKVIKKMMEEIEEPLAYHYQSVKKISKVTEKNKINMAETLEEGIFGGTFLTMGTRAEERRRLWGWKSNNISTRSLV